MTIFQLAVGFCAYYGYNVALFIAIILFIVAYHFTQGPMAWVYVAEVAVDQAFGLITAGIYAIILLFSFTMPYLITNLDASGTFFLFGLLTFCGLIYIGIFLKETKGKTDREKKALFSPVNSTAHLTDAKPQDKGKAAEEENK